MQNRQEPMDKLKRKIQKLEGQLESIWYDIDEATSSPAHMKYLTLERDCVIFEKAYLTVELELMQLKEQKPTIFTAARKIELTKEIDNYKVKHAEVKLQLAKLLQQQQDMENSSESRLKFSH